MTPSLFYTIKNAPRHLMHGSTTTSSTLWNKLTSPNAPKHPLASVMLHHTP